MTHIENVGSAETNKSDIIAISVKTRFFAAIDFRQT